MSRPTPAGPSSHARRGSGPGRHRLERPSGVRASDLPAVRERLATRTADRRHALLRWLLPAGPAGRHTWDFLAGSGGRPRAAFAIILSL
jgi:hypothetical protein